MVNCLLVGNSASTNRKQYGGRLGGYKRVLPKQEKLSNGAAWQTESRQSANKFHKQY